MQHDALSQFILFFLLATALLKTLHREPLVGVIAITVRCAGFFVPTLFLCSRAEWPRSQLLLPNSSEVFYALPTACQSLV